jgi:adenylate cyclase
MRGRNFFVIWLGIVKTARVALAESPQSDAQQKWRKILIEGHRPLRIAHAVFRYLPGPPRCKGCHNPFGGIGGKLAALMGFTPSRKNPNLCAKCCDRLPAGGAEVDIAILFADVRGSTSIGEHLEPGAFAALMNRFYSEATRVLIAHDAIIDKLIGDEVMALFIPGICGAQYHRRAVDAAAQLMRAVGYGSRSGPWIPVGAAVHSGLTYVGNVGAEGVVDFTALGDTVNTTARLAQNAGAGEVLLSDAICAVIGTQYPLRDAHTVTLRGREAPVQVRVLSCARRPG